jgi:hypothetical protein
VTTRRHVGRGIAGAGVVAALATTAGTAVADERPSVALEWSAPSGCPSREEVEERILQLVGDAHSDGRLHARAHLANDGAAGAFRGDVELATASEVSSRHLEGDSCAAVSDAIALIVALAIEPRAGAPEPPAPSPQPSPPADVRPPDVRPPDRKAARRWVFLAASGRLDVGALPAPAVGAEIAVGFRPRHVELEIGGAMLASARATLAVRPDKGADIRLTELGGRGCYEVLDAPLDFGPCVGLHARWLSAEGFGADVPRDAMAVFGVASLGAMAKARLSSWIGLRLLAEAAFPLARPAFEIDNGGTVYYAQAVGLRLSFGAELNF